jgi:hypothetical protein
MVFPVKPQTRAAVLADVVRAAASNVVSNKDLILPPIL